MNGYEESLTPTPYAVICPHHGRVYLTAEAYEAQVSFPDQPWRCPRMDSDPARFGPCGAPSAFDDDTYEAAQEAAEAEYQGSAVIDDDGDI